MASNPIPVVRQGVMKQEDIAGLFDAPDGSTDNGNASANSGGALGGIPTSTFTQFKALTNMSGAGFVKIRLVPSNTIVNIPCVLPT